jgi:hypothetical protein
MASPGETVWVSTPEMKSYFAEVTKAFAEHAGPDEIVTAHGPQTHGREPLHGQINLINRSNGNCFKIKMVE